MKNKIMRFVVVGSYALGNHYRGLCPRCNVLVGLVFKKSGLWWHCNTMDCGFKQRFTGEKPCLADSRR